MAVGSSIQQAALSSKIQSLLTMTVGLTPAHYDNLCVGLCGGDTTQKTYTGVDMMRAGGGGVKNTEHKLTS